MGDVMGVIPPLVRYGLGVVPAVTRVGQLSEAAEGGGTTGEGLRRGTGPVGLVYNRGILLVLSPSLSTSTECLLLLFELGE
jgi:hypothetical protein